MALITRFPSVAAVAIGSASLCLTLAYPQEEPPPDPWFTKEHKRPAQDDATANPTREPATQEEAIPLSIRRANPASLVKRLRRELQSAPETHLGKRIALLEQIVQTDRPKDSDVAALKDATQRRDAALAAIQTANQPALSIESGIDTLAPHTPYYLGDSTLLVTLLKSDFSNRLDRQVSSLSRRNQTTRLAALKERIEQAGLAQIFGTRIKNSADGAASAMVARRWAELLDQSTPLPGEAYLIGQLLNQSTTKLKLAIEMPATTDPRLGNSIARGLETAWGDTFHLTTSDSRTQPPELVLEIDIDRIQSSKTTQERQVASKIPGAVLEEPNPDFLKLVERYEKAAERYQSALDHYEMMYEDYIEEMNNQEYQDAQEDLSQAKRVLESTPPPSGNNTEQIQAYNEAVGMVETAEAVARSIPQPLAIEPTPPYPHHLEILEDLHLVPSTLIISAEETPYEYTEKTHNYLFQTAAPLRLEVPHFEEVAAQSEVRLDQKRSWIANEGVHPRDPAVADGTYSENAYESALDLFGLEFATNCANELKNLLGSAHQQLKSKTDTNSLSQSLLLLALQSATADSQHLQVEEHELEQLARLASSPQTSATQFRTACLSILLSKTEFSHLADPNKLEQLL